jgi:hypothetical protein
MTALFALFFPSGLVFSEEDDGRRLPKSKELGGETHELDPKT